MRPCSLLIGPLGCGKDSVGRKLDALHVSSGELFRKAVGQGIIAKSDNERVGRGLLAEDSLIRDLVASHVEPLLSHPGLPQHVIFNGVVRTGMAQAEWLDEWAAARRLSQPKVLVFRINDADELWRRVQQRAVQENRAEDNLQAFQRRLSDYYELLPLLADYYGSRIVNIDATEPLDVVTRAVARQLNVGLQGAPRPSPPMFKPTRNR